MYGSHDGNGDGDGENKRGVSEPDEPLEQCADVSARLDAYHDGLLLAAEAHAVAAHVANCARCAADLEALAAADQLIRSAPTPRVGPELRQRVYGRIAAARGARRPSLPSTPIRSSSELTMNDSRRNVPRAVVTSRSPRKLTVLLSGLAAALIVALLAGVFLTRGPGPAHSGPTVASSHTPTTTYTCAPSAITANLPAHAYLADLAMTSATDGWAVGAIENTDSSWAKSLILHYSHCQWTQAGPVIPNIELQSISMDSATDGWISGAGNGSTVSDVLLHYTGGQWQQVHVAALDDPNDFFGTIHMLSATEGWMVLGHSKNAQGQLSTSLAHYSNGTWSVLNAPIGYLVNIAPVGPDDVWVIGTVADGNPAGVLAHYQAGQWVATISMGGPVDIAHMSLRMLSPTDGWATAELPGPNDNYSEGLENALVLHYDGNAWHPFNTGADPNAQRVSIFGDGEGWAFGVPRPPDFSLFLSLAQYESGGTWRTVALPASDFTDVGALNRVVRGEYWAVGLYPGSAVLLHFVNGAWTQYGN